MRIIHPDGIWVIHTGLYRFVDPMSGVIFEPGETVRVQATTWLDGQPTIKRLDSDPLAAEKPAQPAAKSAVKPAAPKAG